MASNDYRKMSRVALEGSLARAEGKVARQQRSSDATMKVLDRTIGAMLTGPASAGAIGYLETRFPQKDGSRLSVGPVPLPVFFGAGALVTSLFWEAGANQLAHVASANLGLASGTLMRGYGAVHKAKSDARTATKTKAGAVDPLMVDETREGYVGDEPGEWSAEERELLGVA